MLVVNVNNKPNMPWKDVKPGSVVNLGDGRNFYLKTQRVDLGTGMYRDCVKLSDNCITWVLPNTLVNVVPSGSTITIS